MLCRVHQHRLSLSHLRQPKERCRDHPVPQQAEEQQPLVVWRLPVQLQEREQLVQVPRWAQA
jgi:hypothetical protein